MSSPPPIPVQVLEQLPADSPIAGHPLRESWVMKRFGGQVLARARQVVNRHRDGQEASWPKKLLVTLSEIGRKTRNNVEAALRFLDRVDSSNGSLASDEEITQVQGDADSQAGGHHPTLEGNDDELGVE